MHRIPFRIIENSPAEFDSAKYQAAVSGQAEVLESEEAVLTKIRELVVMLIDEEYGRCGEDDLNRYISDQKHVP